MKTILWLAVAVLTAGAQGTNAPIPPDEKAKLEKLLPVAAAVEVSQFYAGDLYRYIDGGAEAFHNYDMAAMVHRRYMMRGVEVTVDIYDMGDALNAFGVYSSECSPDQHFIRIGTEGNISDTTLNFFQGPFYVKLVAFAENGAAGQVMESFAKSIERQIGPDGAMPVFLSVFPPGHLVPHSQRYVKRAVLGYKFLGPAYMASYALEAKPAVLVLAEAGDSARAAESAEKLRAHFAESGKAESWPGAPRAFRGRNELEGEWLVVPHGRYTVILTNPPAQPGELLKALFANLPS